MCHDIHEWQDIKNGFSGTILLGNGASIAVDSKFRYESLKKHAAAKGWLTDDIQNIFNFFDTDDFELILRVVWHAKNVNRCLDIKDGKTESAYVQVRDCLISVVRDIHSEYGDVLGQIPVIYKFLKKFKTVVSLNYDLIIYWAMMHGNNVGGNHAFKDCFVPSGFNGDWERFRMPISGQESCSLVFYPHGSLILARGEIENEQKISSDGTNLLDGISSKWEEGDCVPLFVSEGNSEQKIRSIHSSYYLSTVFHEVLPNLCSDLVLYGWSLGGQDLHIIKSIAKSKIKKVAVSVFDNDQAYCNRVHQTLETELGGECEIKFFDSKSDGCWNKSDVSP